MVLIVSWIWQYQQLKNTVHQYVLQKSALYNHWLSSEAYGVSFWVEMIPVPDSHTAKLVLSSGIHTHMTFHAGLQESGCGDVLYKWITIYLQISRTLWMFLQLNVDTLACQSDSNWLTNDVPLSVFNLSRDYNITYWCWNAGLILNQMGMLHGSHCNISKVPWVKVFIILDVRVMSYYSSHCKTPVGQNTIYKRRS
jgi:hypothetical protein